MIVSMPFVISLSSMLSQKYPSSMAEDVSVVSFTLRSTSCSTHKPLLEALTSEDNGSKISSSK